MAAIIALASITYQAYCYGYCYSHAYILLYDYKVVLDVCVPSGLGSKLVGSSLSSL